MSQEDFMVKDEVRSRYLSPQGAERDFRLNSWLVIPYHTRRRGLYTCSDPSWYIHQRSGTGHVLELFGIFGLAWSYVSIYAYISQHVNDELPRLLCMLMNSAPLVHEHR